MSSGSGGPLRVEEGGGGAAGCRFGQPTVVGRLWAATVLRLLQVASGGPCQGVGTVRVGVRCRGARRAGAMARPT